MQRCLFSELSENQSSWCEELYQARAKGLVLYGRALGLSHSESEDVLQETFVSLLKLKEQPENSEHYCLRAFRNRATNYRRSLWRRLAREMESKRWFEREEDETPFERAVMRQLAELPVEQREVIVLKFWNSLTFEEISKFTGCPPNTVAGRYRYGIEKLRNRLRKEGYEKENTFGDTITVLETSRPVS